MLLGICSDLHFEFHRDGGQSFAESMKTELGDVDVLVVAGDLATSGGLPNAVKRLCGIFSEVVYCLGNHEFYGSTPRKVEALVGRLADKYSNFHWLDESVTTIKGQRFVGTTLWFPGTPAARSRWHQRMLSDFGQIGNFVPWVYKKAAKGAEFLRQEVQPGDIVVTHHLPSQKCVAPRWVGSPLNPYFVHDVEDVVRDRKAKYWFHGHTHDFIDVTIGETRVLCNPFGYCRIGENPGYRERLVVEV